MKSINSFSLSGRLTKDARFFDSKNGKVARFAIAHNFGKDKAALSARNLNPVKTCTVLKVK